MNINQNEINKFSNMASRWWDKEGDCKPLHQINPLRLQFIQDQINLDNKKVLDVGCGGGILTESMATNKATVTGIDMSSEVIKIAKLHLLESKLNVDYQIITAESLSEKEAGKYDIVTCMEMLEHVDDPESIIQSCGKLAKPNGHVFFSTLNRNIKSYLFAVLGAEYILKLLPRGTHDYDKFIKPSELDKLCRKAGLKSAKMAGIAYNPLTQSYSLTNDLDVNYMVYYQKIS